MTSYTLYIDESGETGISKVRSGTITGASPYMTLGAVLVENENRSRLEKKLAEIEALMGKESIHCSRLKHTQKVFFARAISAEKIVCFGVISLKSTLKWYKDVIRSDAVKYYNKCGQYLLERVSKFMKEYEIDAADLDIIFEEGTFNYAKFRSFIGKCRDNPLHKNTKLLKHISVGKIVAASKAKEPLLQISDLVAHALFKSVDKTDRNFHIPEPRYLYEIQKRFYCDKESGEVLKHGIMALHNLSELKLDAEVHNLISNIEGEMKLP
jgi:Protein of unknown function (DUF3800)